MKKFLLSGTAIALITVLAACSAPTTPPVAGNPPLPQKESLIIKGSDTEVQLVSNLAEAYTGENPGADISVTGGGSAVGIAALLNKQITLANSSRKMKPEELDQGKKNGLDIHEFIVSTDGLSVIVHPDNKLTKLTVDQIGKIYKGEITDWKDVGGAPGVITLYGRQSTSGTYTFFRDKIVKGEYAKSMRNMEGNEAIVSAVESDKSGIGYVGVGYVKDKNDQPLKTLNVLSVSVDDKSPAISPFDVEAVLSKKYPIARAIYQYMGYKPKKGSELEKFLRFESSSAGQKVIEKSGFYKVTTEDSKTNDAFFASIQP